MNVGSDQGVKPTNDVVMNDDEVECAKKVLCQKIEIALRAITM